MRGAIGLLAVAFVGLYGMLWAAGANLGGGAKPSQSPREALAASRPLPESVRIVREGAAASERSYRVECRIVSPRLTFSVPTVTLRDGQRVVISDTSLARCAFPAENQKGDTPSRTWDVQEGTIVTVHVAALDDERAVLDLTVELAGMDGASQRPGQPVRIRFAKGRLIEQVARGGKAAADFQDWRLEATVQ